MIHFPMLMVAVLMAMQTNVVGQGRGVQSDRSVHFMVRAPNANSVSLNLEGADPLKMAKEADGVWSLTTKPLPPDIYGYSFSVDGIPTLDVSNPSFKPNLIWQSNMVLVPGNPPEAWEVQDVPHGSLTHHFYKSNVSGDQRGYYVYTPPGYEARARQKYPVLYLLHGYSDTEDGWSAVGRANVILDNLIANHKANPMVVVMPLGYGVPNFASASGPAFSDRKLTSDNYSKFRAALIDEVMPQVEREYSVSVNKKDRAIAGLSMGGAETLFVGLSNLEKFSYVGAFSSGGLTEDFDRTFPGLNGGAANRSLKVFTVACGVDDGLISFNRHLVTWLKAKGVQVDQIETPGRHTWMVWRRDLIEFAQKLFK